MYLVKSGEIERSETERYRTGPMNSTLLEGGEPVDYTTYLAYEIGDPDRGGLTQRVKFFDAFDVRYDSMMCTEPNGWRVTGQWEGVTTEGFGNGVRLLMAEDVESSEVASILRSMADILEKQQ